MTKYYNKGAVVLSITGREKNEVFIIQDVDNDYAYLINGKTRPIEKPKKKNLKHLNLLCKSEDAKINFEGLTNANVIKFIKDYNKSRDNK